VWEGMASSERGTFYDSKTENLRGRPIDEKKGCVGLGRRKKEKTREGRTDRQKAVVPGAAGGCGRGRGPGGKKHYRPRQRRPVGMGDSSSDRPKPSRKWERSGPHPAAGMSRGGAGIERGREKAIISERKGKLGCRKNGVREKLSDRGRDSQIADAGD